MANASKNRTGAAGIGLVWLLVNAAGWGLGFGLEFAIIHTPAQGGLATLFGTLIAAGVIGLAQWLALRWLMPPLRPGSQGMAWVILTLFGFTAGFVAGAMISSLVPEDAPAPALALTQFLSWALVGAGTGVLQWAGLKGFARGGGWWIGSNALGYGLGSLLLTQLRLESLAGPFTYALMGLVVGVTTLAALARLRRRTAPGEGV